ncbi:MAG: hypothetical protein WA005_17220 [Candidatus Binataceae bacterium]
MPQFNPASLNQYAVFQLLPDANDRARLDGRFIVIGHIEKGSTQAAVVCLEPTTNTEHWREPGFVCYEADEVECFNHRTVIEPVDHKRLVFPYEVLIRADRKGLYRELHPLPQDFCGNLFQAVADNRTLNARDKARWRKFLEDNQTV